MGLGDFILLVNRLGLFGLIITIIFVSVMLMGSIVDIYQFLWRVKRHKKRRQRSLYNKIKSQVLMELHETNRK